MKHARADVTGEDVILELVLFIFPSRYFEFVSYSWLPNFDLLCDFSQDPCVNVYFDTSFD